MMEFSLSPDTVPAAWLLNRLAESQSRHATARVYEALAEAKKLYADHRARCEWARVALSARAGIQGALATAALVAGCASASRKPSDT
jgi:hypothetical protein